MTLCFLAARPALRYNGSVKVREEWQPYIVAWRERRRREVEEQERRVEAARAAARECARVLVEQYSAQRVWLFGSLAHRRFLHAASDVDLAVEGLPAEVYFQALAMIWDLLPPGFELDLVPLEGAKPDLLGVIQKEGELLYERT